MTASDGEVTHRAVAFHEAGHVVFAWRHGVMLRGPVTILRSGSNLGHTPLDRQTWPGCGALVREHTGEGAEVVRAAFERNVKEDLEICLAGPLAEKRHRRLRTPPGSLWLPGGSGDREMIDAVIQEVAAAEDWPKAGDAHHSRAGLLVGLTAVRVSRLLRYPRTWAAVEVIADALAKGRTLEPEEADALLQHLDPPTDDR